MKKRILSCIQPTGSLHIGNYFGAIKLWLDLQSDAGNECVFGVVDLHAMTAPYDAQVLRSNTLGMMTDLLACGLDPAKCTLFLQSLIPEHTELAWILGCVCPYGDLTRMTQFKDKRSHIEEASTEGFISAGLVNYPVLQAADILLYKAHHVPVGADQKQHLELTRDIAGAFNRRFGEVFPLPGILLTETPKLMSLAAPDRKMSKSLGDKHFIGLFEDAVSVREKVKSAVTDSGEVPAGLDISPGVANLFQLLAAAGRKDLVADFTDLYRKRQLKYGILKDEVVTALMAILAPIAERRAVIREDYVLEITYEGSRIARRQAVETLAQAREAAGLLQRQ